MDGTQELSQEHQAGNVADTNGGGSNRQADRAMETTQESFASSFLAPPFLRHLAAPWVKKVVLVGCGGGFDFVHSMLLYPELIRMGKQVTIVSNSFGDVEEFNAEPLFPRKGGTQSAPMAGSNAYPDIRLVTASTAHRNPGMYAPEIHLLSFLDGQYPRDAPHTLYACNARSMTVPSFSPFLESLGADALVAFDGGSDSLMAGDEEGLGDPAEDAVTVGSIHGCSAPVKLLISVGLGCDRYNHVSDASSLRAVAELTRAGGFRGCLSAYGPALDFYRSCLEYINSKQNFRSVLSGSIAAAGMGYYGADGDAAAAVGTGRVRPGECFLWPLMPLLWALDIDAVADRSRIVSWVQHVTDPRLLEGAVAQGRQFVNVRDVEELPRHVNFRC